MIELTSAHDGNMGHKLAINPKHIVSIFIEFEGETRIEVVTGTVYIVSETLDNIVTLLNQQNQP